MPSTFSTPGHRPGFQETVSHSAASPASSHRPPSPPSGLDRRILSLAVPALGALVAEPLFVLIDSAMVGHLGATSLAGLSLASSVLTTVVGLFVFLAYATTATTARLFGAGDRRGPARRRRRRLAGGVPRTRGRGGAGGNRAASGLRDGGGG